MNYFGISYSINGSEPVLGYIALPDNMPANWLSGFYQYLRDTKNADTIAIYHLSVQINSNSMGDKILRYKTSEQSDFDAYTNMQNEFEEALGNTKYYPKSPSTEAILRAWFNFTGSSKISF